MKWRFLELERGSGPANMAFDQALYEFTALVSGLPAIRFYQWSTPTISLGAYQSVHEVDLEACKHYGISLVRRMSGGKSFFHGVHDISYAVIVPIKEFNFSIATLHRSIFNSVAIGLKSLGLKPTLHASGVLMDNKKVMTCASKALEKGFYLNHGTIYAESAPDYIKDIISDFSISSIKHKGLYSALQEGFTKEKDLLTSPTPDQVKKRCGELEQSRYVYLKPLRVSPERVQSMDQLSRDPGNSR